MPVVPKGCALFLRVARTCVFVIGVTGAYAGGVLHSTDAAHRAHRQTAHSMRAESAALTCPEPQAPWSTGYRHSHTLSAPTGPIPLQSPLGRPARLRT